MNISGIFPQMPASLMETTLASDKGVLLNGLFAQQMDFALLTALEGETDLNMESGESEPVLDQLLSLLEELQQEGLLTEDVLASLPLEGNHLLMEQQPERNTVSIAQWKEVMTNALIERGLTLQQAGKLTDLLLAVQQQSAAAGEGSTVTLPEAVTRLLQQVETLMQQTNVTKAEQQTNSAGKSKAMVMLHSPARFASESQVKANHDVSVAMLRMRQASQTYQAETLTAKATDQLSRVREAFQASFGAVEEMDGRQAVQADEQSATVPIAFKTDVTPWTAKAESAAPAMYRMDVNRFVQEAVHTFVKSMKITQTQGLSEAKLILYPQSLGQVDVKIVNQNGVITVHFAADTAAGRDALDQQISQLRTALINQGLQVERIEVTHTSSASPSYQQQTATQPDQQQGQQGHQADRQQDNRDEQKDQPRFNLEEILDQLRVNTTA